MTLRGSMKAHLKDARTKKIQVEILAGENLQKKTGKWMDKHRRIDHPADQYEETVTDPETGEIIHHCKERLSEHTGHGSAKYKRPKQSKKPNRQA
jgi:hypothetical protein